MKSIKQKLRRSLAWRHYSWLLRRAPAVRLPSASPVFLICGPTAAQILRLTPTRATWAPSPSAAAIALVALTFGVGGHSFFDPDLRARRDAAC